MSAYTYTQEDLERAQDFRTKHTEQRTPMRLWDESLAALIAQVRAEAQQAFFNNPNVQKVGRSLDTRLAAAEKLATSIRELLDKSHYPLAERQARKNLSEWEEAAK